MNTRKLIIDAVNENPGICAGKLSRKIYYTFLNTIAYAESLAGSGIIKSRVVYNGRKNVVAYYPGDWKFESSPVECESREWSNEIKNVLCKMTDVSRGTT